MIVAPKLAWQELAAQRAGDVAYLPSPALHGAAVGGCSVLFAALATAAYGGANFGSVLRATLAAVGGSVGATAAAVSWVPSLLSARVPMEATQAQLARYASIASLPLAAGGLISLVPHAVPKTIAIALLSALAYRSGSIGARTFLGLVGAAKARVASVTAICSTLPALLAALLSVLR